MKKGGMLDSLRSKKHQSSGSWYGSSCYTSHDYHEYERRDYREYDCDYDHRETEKKRTSQEHHRSHSESPPPLSRSSARGVQL